LEDQRFAGGRPGVSRSLNLCGADKSKEMCGENLGSQRQALQEKVREGFRISPKSKSRRGKPMVIVGIICRRTCVWVELFQVPVGTQGVALNQ
jgi:hypothetical protein